MLLGAEHLAFDGPGELEGTAEEYVAEGDKNQLRRHHVHEGSVHAAVTAAVRKDGNTKKVTCHTFRHS